MSNALTRCMETLDVHAARGLWGAAFPHLPAPATDADMLTMLHLARTQTESLSFRLRAYSHRWLLERDLPSQLPDRLKPSAERVYPRVVQAVGISFKPADPLLKPAYDLIRGKMEDAVLDADADGRIGDSPFVRGRMAEAKEKEKRALFGRIGLIKIGGV